VVETDPLIGVVVNDGGASVGAHARGSPALTSHATSGDDLSRTDRFAQTIATLRVSGTVRIGLAGRATNIQNTVGARGTVRRSLAIQLARDNALPFPERIFTLLVALTTARTLPLQRKADLLTDYWTIAVVTVFSVVAQRR